MAQAIDNEVQMPRPNLMDDDLIQLSSPTGFFSSVGSVPSSPIFQGDANPSLPFIANPIQYVHPQVTVLNNYRDYRADQVAGNGNQPMRRGSSRVRLHSSSSTTDPDSILEISPATPHPPLRRTSSGYSNVSGTQQLLSFGERLRRLNILAEQEIQAIDQSRSNKDNATCKILNALEQLDLSVERVIKGADITDLLKFCLRLPMQSEPNGRQEKLLKQMDSALFKECGFEVPVQIMPMLCYQHKTTVLNLPRSLRKNHKSISLVVLLEVRNKKNKSIIIDSDSRVYSSFGDWQKNNTLPPATLFGPLRPRCQNNNQMNFFPCPMFKTPSCQTRRIVINAFDIIIGIGAVSAGVACLVTTGGLIFIPASLIAGEIAASLYMGIRGTMSLHDKRKHQARRR